MPRLTSTDWLARSSAAFPKAVALVCDDGRAVTYGELDELAGRSAAFLRRSFDLDPGDLVGLAVRPRLDMIVALWGIGRLGATPAVLAPVSPILTTAAGRSLATWGIEQVVTEVSTGEAVGSGPDVTRDVADLHTVVFTSGTHGRPRPVQLTHGNVASAIAASRARIGNDSTDRWLLALPLFHVGGLSVLWRSAAAGGTVVIHGGFDAARVAATLRRGEVTIASLVPTMLHRVLEVDPGPYRGLRAVLVGGAPASRGLLERARGAGLPVAVTYGMTETCSQVATAVPDELGDEEGVVGLPLDGMDVSIVDGGGHPVPNGAEGEIVVAGPAVSPGYLGEPPREGPHRTGDLGRFDASGRLVVLGRKDDVIISGGENVHPAAVESVLEFHPVVRRAVVVGVPDDEWGELVTAVLVVAEEVGPIELGRWARERLARQGVPRRWVFVDELPMLAAGKVDREAVAALARAATGQV